MSRLSILKNDLRNLALKSKNQCAFPGCSKNLISNEDDFIGQVCHIEAAEPNGERYNESMNDEERRSPDNLILLCYDHHIVTNNVEIYTTIKLQEMKKNHENSNISDLDIDRLDFVLKEFEKRLDIKSSDEIIQNNSSVLYYFFKSIETNYLNYQDKRDLIKLPISRVSNEEVSTREDIIKWSKKKFVACVAWVNSLEDIEKLFPKINLLNDLDSENKNAVDCFNSFIFEKYEFILEYYLDIESIKNNDKSEFVLKKYLQLANQLLEDIDDFLSTILNNLKELNENVNIVEGGPEFNFIPTLSMRGFNFNEITDYLENL